MKIVATYHGPTSVSHSVKCKLTEDEDLDFLVVAKTNILQVFLIDADALRLQCTFDVWGNVAALRSTVAPGTARARLLLLTDHPDPRLLLLEYSAPDSIRNPPPELTCTQCLQLYERGARPSEFCNDVLVDEVEGLAVVSTYVGKCKVVPLRHNTLSVDFDAPVRELNILSMCLVRQPRGRSELAFLHRDHTQKLILTTYGLSPDGLDTASASSSLPNIHVPYRDLQLLIPVPPQDQCRWMALGGVLVLGGEHILYFAFERKLRQGRGNSEPVRKKIESREPTMELRWPYSDITAWSRLDDVGDRYFLGDAFGRLAVLVIGSLSQHMRIIELGEASSPTTLTPLSSQFVFLGSHFGDSQVIRIDPAKSSPTGTYVEIVDRMTNLAPIMDAALIDSEGYEQIVTCSGGRNTGSLRVVRNGADFVENARVSDLPNITKLFPLKQDFDAEYHSYILISFPTATHLLEIPSSPPAESFKRRSVVTDLIIDAPTVAAANVAHRTVTTGGVSEYRSSSHIVQVTANVVQLLNIQTGVSVSKWWPASGQEIVQADVSPSQVCIALAGSIVVLLNILDENLVWISSREFGASSLNAYEVSSLAFEPPQRYSSRFVYVGFWEGCGIQSLSLNGLENKGEFVRTTHPPTSMVPFVLGKSSRFLLVGQTNGTTAVFTNEGGQLREGSVVALGNEPVYLKECKTAGQRTVIASAEHSALFYYAKERLQYSPVLFKGVVDTCVIHSSRFPHSMVFASDSGVVIGRVLGLERVHIRAIHTGLDNPIKIACLAEAQALGVGFIREDSRAAVDKQQISSTFKVLDAVTFEVAGSYAMEMHEEITALTATVLAVDDTTLSAFLVGTMFDDFGEKEPTRGRVLVFKPSHGGAPVAKKPSLLTSMDVDGCVYAIAVVNGVPVASINAAVVAFGINFSHNVETTLYKLAEWNHNYLVSSLAVHGDLFVAGDAINSVTVLKIEDGRIVTIARDYTPLWPLCLAISESTIVGANSDSNLFSFTIDADRRTLECDGAYFAGVTVNKFIARHKAVDNARASFFIEHYFFTSSGQIGVIINSDLTVSYRLSCLQRNMDGVVQDTGLEHTSWRAPATSRGRSDGQAAAFGFLDGDFLERLLSYSTSSREVEAIMAGKNEAEKLDDDFLQYQSLLKALQDLH